MAAWSIVQQRGLDVKKAQTNPSTDPNSSDQDHSWRGSSSSGLPCGLCFGFICRVFKQSILLIVQIILMILLFWSQADHWGIVCNKY